MKCQFNAGDKVLLNTTGFQMLNGPMESRDEAVSAVSVLTIAEIGIEVYDGVWDITLNGPLGKYMLDTTCITPVR